MQVRNEPSASVCVYVCARGGRCAGVLLTRRAASLEAEEGEYRHAAGCEQKRGALPGGGGGGAWGGQEESECEYQEGMCLNALRCEILLEAAALGGQVRDVLARGLPPLKLPARACLGNRSLPPLLSSSAPSCDLWPGPVLPLV